MKSVTLRLAKMLEGLSAEAIILILVVGLVFGTFPLYGAPTVLCLLAAPALRLNLAALQLVNQLASPLQLALFFPLSRLGAHILGPLAPASHGMLSRFTAFTVQAATGWLFVLVPAGLVLYLVLPHTLPAFRRRWLSIRETIAE